MITNKIASVLVAFTSLAALPVLAVPAFRTGVYGSSDGGRLVLINEATGAATPICTFVQGGTEIVYDKAAARAFQQLSDGAFQIVEVNLNNCANIGAVIGDAHAYNGLEYVGAGATRADRVASGDARDAARSQRGRLATCRAAPLSSRMCSPVLARSTM